MKKESTGLTYRDAGVDIEAGESLVERIKPYVAQTKRPEANADIGGFAGLFALPLDKYQQPLLISSTDGVGTKLKLALEYDKLDTIGIDLVAMCVNDIIVCGAEPLFFLDYFATSKLNVEQATTVIKGICAGCIQAHVTLLGGETAEMPGLYQKNDFDLAGFSVGIVEKHKIIDGQQIKPGDKVIALASTGFHSNGYSLVRKVIEDHDVSLAQDFHGQSLLDALLAPTKIYVTPLLDLINTVPIKGIANITGGGITHNLPRVLPPRTNATIKRSQITLPPLFTWIQELGGIDDDEMFRAFNCGMGMIIVCDERNCEPACRLLADYDIRAWPIGEITQADQEKPRVVITDAE